jgi:transketolase
MALEPFAQRFPDRFFNVGVAEQNMVGVATGLAEAGFIPFTYSIVTFSALRPYEFIRNGPVLQNLPVRIVAIGGGFEYGAAGPTHHGLEDVGVMRIQPSLRVIAPADHQQAYEALLSTWELPGPTYYRLGKDDKQIVRGLEGRFRLGEPEIVREGADALMLGMGAISSEAVLAAETLAGRGIHCTVGIVSTLNPAPDLSELCKRYRRVFTVEAHYVVGGLGSLVAEQLAGQGLSSRLVRLGVERISDGRSGSQKYFLENTSSTPQASYAASSWPCDADSMSYQKISIILPVHNQATHIHDLITDYRSALDRLPPDYEILLIENGSKDGSLEECRSLAEAHPKVKLVVSEKSGWGRAVRLGLRHATGDLLCYTNSARTSAPDLTLFLAYAIAQPNVVIKANRKVRESWRRRLGSLAYNLECRAFFDLPTWDINGTPKLFPRTFGKLLELTRDDDLIDCEFNVVCRQEEYPVLEVPIVSTRRHSGKSTTNYSSAIKMYIGAYQMYRRRRPPR